MASCQHKKEEKKETPQFLVTSPFQTDTTIFKTYVAQIQSANHIELRSQERGYLEQIFVDEGQLVKKGQILFKIKPLLYQVEVAKAKAELNFAEVEYRNTKSLEANNVVSTNELALAKAKLDKAKAELQLAEAHLLLTEIRAPFDGILDKFLKRTGSLIDEGELLTTLSNNQKMWVYFNVPETEYLNYQQQAQQHNSSREVSLEMANGELFYSKGKVETIEADFNNETGNIAFRATFFNNKQLLRHGETGNILMPFILHKAILIPQTASFDVLDKKYVYVVNANNQLVAKQIEVAYELPHLYVVSNGLTVTDKIVAEGLGKVKPNEKISYQFKSFNDIMLAINHIHAE